MAKRRFKSGLQPYGSYFFMEKDPVIDELRTMMADFSPNGKITHKVMEQIHQGGGPTASCQKAWLFGKTRRPTNPSIESAGRSMGWKREWVSMNASEKAHVRKRLAKISRKKK